MAATVLDTIEYIVLLVTQFASGLGISESEAYGYLCRYCTPTTGLYFQSSGYVYSHLLDELNR